MRFSEKWLRDWVDPAVPAAELAAQLTMAGLEVDAVEPAAGVFHGVVVGAVLEVIPHPDADKLRVCRVDAGQGEPLQIVCGAPNVDVGMRVPAALVGAELPGGMKIKRAKLRGVESLGMLCSARELGLADDHQGLMDLPADAPVGTDLRAWLELDDTIIDVDLTPNRGDCLGIAGIAREVGVLNRCPVAGPAMAPVAATHDVTFPVEVRAAAACPRYLGRVIRGVDPQAGTPLWMQERLRRSGLRSLGPVVDVTNYVLLELGQPMHAFDLTQLRGALVVREAEAGEHLTLLDGRDVELALGTLVIADRERPLAIAGVMGGEDSGVGENTRDLFLECAFFSPAAIAGRARQYGLQTDSAYRFERGVDFTLQQRAMERATALLLELAGGSAGPVIEVCAPDHLPARDPIVLRAARIQRLLGLELPAAEVEDILVRLGMTVTPVQGGWTVVPPPFRFDIALEPDLIEELARIHGYDNLPRTTVQGRLQAAPAAEAVVGTMALRQILVARGYQEAVTYSFVDPALQAVLDPEHPPLPLANPLSADLAVMRTSLWPGLVKALQHNRFRQQERVRLFECGLRFVKQQNELKQENVISGVIAGSVAPEQWGVGERPADFFDLKGDVEALLAPGGAAETFTFRPGRHPALHPGQAAQLWRGDEAVGWLGRIHPRVARELDLPDDSYVFEILTDSLRDGRVARFREVSRFPAIRRDLALLVDAQVPAQSLREAAAAVAPELLREVRVFDVYQGDRIENGRKSIALGLILQDSSRTLTDEEVDSVITRMTDRLREEFRATLRE